MRLRESRQVFIAFAAYHSETPRTALPKSRMSDADNSDGRRPLFASTSSRGNARPGGR